MNTINEQDLGRMHGVFAKQCAAFEHAPYPDMKTRKAALRALRQSLKAHSADLIRALDQDFSARPAQETLFIEIGPTLSHIAYTLRHLRGWMRPQRRSAGLNFFPATARVVFQPLGVVGIISPFNYPVLLTLTPLINAIAAGNRVMLKLSEHTPRTTDVLRMMLGECFPEEQVAVITGGHEIAAEFTRLPFDHLMFIGSTRIGRMVMKEAAANLTPVTLELGGKSPAIIARDMPLASAVERICYAKSLNAGQTCVAPDYVLLPKEWLPEFISRYRETFQHMYPDAMVNKDYCSIISQQARERLQQWLDDAVAKGARIEIIGNEETGHATDNWRMPMHLVAGVTDDMAIMQNELFGPILPILTYEHLKDAVGYVRTHPRPLALYLFTHDRTLQEWVALHTHAGSLCINDAVIHYGVDDLPMGGVGESGMGQYRGRESFYTFSKTKSVLKKGRINPFRFIYPPYGGWVQKMVTKWLMR